jgi:hypothetical protein
MDCRKRTPGAEHLHSDVVERIERCRVSHFSGSDFLSWFEKKSCDEDRVVFSVFPPLGRSWTTGIEILDSSASGPVPERRSILGESMAPAARITSLDAEYSFLMRFELLWLSLICRTRTL